jgi:hypothetical protein
MLVAVVRPEAPAPAVAQGTADIRTAQRIGDDVTRSAGRLTARTIVVGICALAVAVLFTAVARQSWTTNAAAAEVVHMEANGAAVLHPMTSLLSDLVAAQSAAVRGERVNMDAIREALGELVVLNGEQGDVLRVGQRISDLTSQVESSFARAETGRAAYETYSALVSLTVEMIRRVGDSSHLIHDPDLDSYYLMDAAIIRLPDAMVYAGRAADLVALAGGKALMGEDQVRAAVARFSVAYDAEQVGTGLNMSVDFTARSDLGTNIAERLDSFRAAADAFAPPTMLQELATTVDAAAMAASARRVSAAANSLAHRLLSELQALLDVRKKALEQEQRFTAVTAAAVGLIGFALLWLVIAGRPRRRPTSRFGAIPVDEPPVGSVASAREMVDAEQLVQAGRGQRRGSDNAF